MDCKREELLIATVARLLKGCGSIAVGRLVSDPGFGGTAVKGVE